MRFLSICSGIESASVAWEPLGWTPLAFSEIAPFPAAVLRHRWPHIPNLGDLTLHHEWPARLVSQPDVLIGGTPCQSFSVAGLRRGLADPRGNLALVFLALVAARQPRWIVWENVAGVLAANGGRDFGTLLGALAQLGYGWAYRVLDAQHFGVPQRRRRVFVVGCLGDFRRAAAVLFERHSLQGHPAPRREAGEGVAGTFKACAGSGGWSNIADHASAGYMIPCNTVHTLRARGHDASEDGTGRGTPLVAVSCDGGADVVPPLMARSSRGGAQTLSPGHQTDGHCIATFTADNYALGTCEATDQARPLTTSADRTRAAPIAMFDCRTVRGQCGAAVETDIVSTLRSSDHKEPQVLRHGAMVRRLTPRECERLQGFPDDYTLVPYRKKPAADGPRYKALGNSMAVPVMRWIGERIQAVDDLRP